MYKVLISVKKLSTKFNNSLCFQNVVNVFTNFWHTLQNDRSYKSKVFIFYYVNEKLPLFAGLWVIIVIY